MLTILEDHKMIIVYALGEIDNSLKERISKLPVKSKTLDLRQYPIKDLHNQYKDYLRICLIQHPLKRIIAIYESLIIHGNELNALFRNDSKINYPTLDNFILDVDKFSSLSKEIKELVQPQTNIISADLDGFDRVFRLEHLSELEAFLAKHLDVEVSLKVKKKKSYKLSEHMMSQQSRERLLQMYQEDIRAISRYYRFAARRSTNFHDRPFYSILIVTYGRTGSTLLAGVLNTATSVLIRGENFDFCGGMFRSYKALVKTRLKGAKESTDPFFGSDWNEPYFLNMCSTMLRNLLVQETNNAIYGFKEVRYQAYDKEELFDYLDFLQLVFPKLALVFNLRDTQEVIKSRDRVFGQEAWWKNKPHQTRVQDLKESENFFKEYSVAKDNCFFINYADVKTNSDKLKDLFKSLGLNYDRAKINKTLKLRHSYTS